MGCVAVWGKGILACASISISISISPKPQRDALVQTLAASLQQSRGLRPISLFVFDVHGFVVCTLAASEPWWTACRWTSKWRTPDFTTSCKRLPGTAAHPRHG